MNKAVTISGAVGLGIILFIILYVWRRRTRTAFDYQKMHDGFTEGTCTGNCSKRYYRAFKTVNSDQQYWLIFYQMGSMTEIRFRVYSRGEEQLLFQGDVINSETWLLDKEYGNMKIHAASNLKLLKKLFNQDVIWV